MVQRKAVFIIPGFRQSAKSAAYEKLAKILKKAGFNPVPVNISWKNKTISKNTEQFLEIYKKHKASEKYILGFSYGAMVAFIASAKVKPSGIILCSLSPYFQEDVLRKSNRAQSSLEKKRFEDFLNLRAESLAKKNKAKKIIMLYGTNESRPLIARVKQTFEKIDSRQKLLIKVTKTEHTIGDNRYLSKIHEAAVNFL